MKNFFSILFLFFSTIVFAESPVLNIQHWELKNKTRVFFVKRNELPMLDIALVFSAGSSRDGDQKGLAAETNEMIGQGAKNLSANQTAETFEKAGAEFHTIINRDMAGITLRTLTNPDHLNPAIDNLKTLITSPTFPENEFNRIKQMFIAQIKMQFQDPEVVASNRFHQLLYQNKFYATGTLGTLTSINASKVDQLNAFYKRYYTGANANLILVGNITDDEAKRLSEKIAGSLPEGKPAETLTMAEDLKVPVKEDISFPSIQSTLIIGQVGITRQNPDYYALMVGNAIFGGMPMSSILYTEIREKKGLAYIVSSNFDPLEYRGPFMIELQTKTSTVNEANAIVTDALKTFIQNGPTEQQLDSAKSNLIHAFPLAISSNSGILSLLTKVAFYHRPLNYFDTYAANISHVTRIDVKNAFQKNIDPNKMVTVVVGIK